MKFSTRLVTLILLAFCSITQSVAVEADLELSLDAIGEKPVETAASVPHDEIRGEGSEGNEEEEATSPPEPLTIENFDSTLSEGMHFVEFFSPYCHHCKALAPIWHEFQKSFKQEGEQLGVQIHQVDCIASGDLCGRESIRFYPALKLYTANEAGTGGEVIAQFTKAEGRTVEGFSEFVRDRVAELQSEIAMSPSDLKQLHVTNNVDIVETSELLNIIGGKEDKPYLLSFWPSTDEQLNQKTFQNDPKENKLYSESSSCLEFRNVWNNVVRGLPNELKKKEIGLGYVNCQSNEMICTALGLENLVHGDTTATPTIFAFLPSDQGGNKIKFKDRTATSKIITKWTKRLLSIYRFEDTDVTSLKKKMKLLNKLPNDATNVETEPEEIISFVYLYNEETYFDEDDILLKHLIQPIMDMRTNVHLFKSSDLKFLDLLKRQEQALVGYINDGTAEIDEKYEFDEIMYTARTLSTFPMLICLKSNSLTSTVFQSFGTRDIRDYAHVMNFIKINSQPVQQELNTYTQPAVFPNAFDSTTNSKTEKVLIVLDDPTKSKKVTFTISYIHHSFNYFRTLTQFKKLSDARELKRLAVADLKASDAEQSDIVVALRKKIPKVFKFQEHNLNIVYLDLSKLEYFSKVLKWDRLNLKNYKKGDVIIVSKFGNQYWDRDSEGDKLEIENKKAIIETLKLTITGGSTGKALRSNLTFTNVLLGLVVIIAFYLLLSCCRRTRLLRIFSRSRKNKGGLLDPESGFNSGNSGDKVD
ncbi:hypothetical protein CANARDRAFT_6488 [[Candida] arabinofermentans NRRL YB-2248]|uniref:Thioredoxin domain-containing protein n=1 Tax=[Candida] arabinofermentans NRRL YB-2248 TaxID=983967 RepID=A0A1E4T579_9ASCO|nr:hypothetical protein CANARDRAFT_6488 [[Candida] arabinofermentans NRRL YB-2248]